MAIVNALKFDDYSGAIVADEEYWMQRRRRSYFRNNLHSLLDEAASNTLGMEAVYGGFGHPSFDYEIVMKTREKMKGVATKPTSKKKTGGKQTAGVSTVEDVGKILLEVTQETSKRRNTEKLRYLFGFGIDDFNRGYFVEDGKKYEIKQDTVKKMAMDIIEGKHKLPFVQPITENRGVLIGYAPEDGFGSYYLNTQESVLSFTSGGFEAIGTGKYASGIALGKFLNRRTIPERYKGFDRVEGILELITASIAAADHYHEVGGYFNMVYINGHKKTHNERYLEIFDHRAQLTTELVRANQAHMIRKDTALDLINRIIFEGDDFDQVEDEMFRRSTDSRKLEKILRGYKLSLFDKSKGTRTEKPKSSVSRSKTRTATRKK